MNEVKMGIRETERIIHIRNVKLSEGNESEN